MLKGFSDCSLRLSIQSEEMFKRTHMGKSARGLRSQSRKLARFTTGTFNQTKALMQNNPLNAH